MSPQVLRRFIILMVALTAVLVVGTHIIKSFVDRSPGDFNTELGDNRLSDGKYAEALDFFNKALDEVPGHRGALMGRAIAFIQMKRYPEALDELTFLIDRVRGTVKPDDETTRGLLASAYANRGIVRDLQGKYEMALKDYVRALNVDADAVDEPGVINKVLYADPNPSSVRKRAQYIYEQLQKPEKERLMRVPKIDAGQRMHKP